MDYPQAAAHYHPDMAITHLLYLHGFRSSPQSHKAQAMAAYMGSHFPQVQWWCPQLPPSPAAGTLSGTICARAPSMVSKTRYPVRARAAQGPAPLRNSYAVHMPPGDRTARIPMRPRPSMPAKESSMLDIAFFGGGLALFCLLIAYERLCHRL